MSKQPSLFDYDRDKARLARESAIKRVGDNAEHDWKDVAYESVLRTASELDSFIVDEVWKRMPKGYSTHENRAMGAIIRKAVSDGVIAKTDQYRPSAKKSSHGAIRSVWRSLIKERRVKTLLEVFTDE